MEVATTTAVAVFIVFVAFSGEWAIILLGKFFNSTSTSEAKLFKYSVFLFDVFLYGNMLIKLFKRQKEEE